MNQYFATFPAGTYEIIARHLKSFKLDELKLNEHDDSSVVFQSSWTVERLIELRYFTNIYLVINKASDTPKTAFKGKYYRLMLLKDGTPQPLSQSERSKLEARIQNEFGLEANTHLSKNDFYLIERTSGKQLFTLRLPRTKFKREKLAAGELRPELAHILCLAAGLKSKHTLVDMFAGYGSIPFEAVRGFGCKQVIAADTEKLTNRHEHSLIKWFKDDARKLDFISDSSVDRVITDPPWGIYDSKIDNLSSLYAESAKEMVRILKPDGVAVVLSGFSEAEPLFEQSDDLKLIGKWRVLVSGKKATIYKLQKVR